MFLHPELSIKREKKIDRATPAGTPTNEIVPDPPEKGSSLDDTAVSPDFNFKSAEFNQIDELDDNVGNYRNFQTLSGVVTADMRHHEERKKMKQHPETPVSEPEGSVSFKSDDAKEMLDEKRTLPLTIVSKGRVLIIGNDAKLMAECGEILKAQKMRCTLLLPNLGDGSVSQSETAAFSLMRVDSVTVRGAFGGFKATLERHGDHETHLFDLVLDLYPTPSFAGKQLPAGYYAPGVDEAEIAQALLELPEMKGLFKKPQFTLYRQTFCLHGKSRGRECRRCLNICPVGAIRSEDRKIVIDPYVCQGCGSCALVCPADAIHLMNPPQEELLTAMQCLLTDSLAAEGSAPNLVVHDSSLALDRRVFEKTAGRTGEEGRIFYQVDDISRMGLEFMLALLAYGAGSITLVCDRETPSAIRQALEEQMELGALILRGLDLEEERLRFVVQGVEGYDAGNGDFQQTASGPRTFNSLLPLAAFSADHDKRSLMRLAVEHLSEVSEVESSVLPLPEGAPFGDVAIDSGSCTLCMACVGVCPSKALSASGEIPRLTLVESRCHQCGLCVEACPENAVGLIPRLLCTVAASETPSVLREVEPFRCIECGEPFASQAMISRMTEKLTGHWMYSSERQQSRLQMCRSCRTCDALMAKDFRS